MKWRSAKWIITLMAPPCSTAEVSTYVLKAVNHFLLLSLVHISIPDFKRLLCIYMYLAVCCVQFHWERVNVLILLFQVPSGSGSYRDVQWRHVYVCYERKGCRHHSLLSGPALVRYTLLDSWPVLILILQSKIHFILAWTVESMYLHACDKMSHFESVRSHFW